MTSITNFFISIFFKLGDKTKGYPLPRLLPDDLPPPEDLELPDEDLTLPEEDLERLELDLIVEDLVLPEERVALLPELVLVDEPFLIVLLGLE
jgi:hypothetical protein